MEKWYGKNCVVTGASSGIGAAIVRSLAKAGINVIALARRERKLNALKEELLGASGKVTAIVCDVADESSVESTFEKIEQNFGTIHILVNNAGVLKNVRILDNDDKEPQNFGMIEQVIQTNLTGLILTSRKAFRLMGKTGDYGMIINIGSITGHGVPNINLNWGIYPATKHAVRAATETMRLELVKDNNKKIRVSEISPGFVETEIIEAGGNAVIGENWLDNQGFPYLKDVDVAQAVEFLLTTPYSVNITEIIIKPTGEKF